MNIIVIGAGELGRLLASALSEEDHNVVVVDSDADKLARISDKFDAMTVTGSCSSVRIMKQAGAENADAVLAVSGDEAANILACQIANKLGVKHTVCRLYSNDCFSEDDGILQGWGHQYFHDHGILSVWTQKAINSAVWF